MSPNKTGDPAVLEEDGFLYTVTNGQAEIIGLPMGFTDLAELPSVIGGHPVKAVSADAFGWPEPKPPVYRDGDGEYVAPDGVIFDVNRTVIKDLPHDLEDLVIPASVTTIKPNVCNLTFLKSIRVEAGNRHFAGVDGMLFNADASELLVVPSAMAGSCRIPASVKRIAPQACGFIPSVSALDVDPENETFRSVDGVVYTRDLSALVVIPDGFAGTLTIPQGVRRVGAGHIGSVFALKCVRFPASVTAIYGDWTFWDSLHLVSFEVDPGNPSYCSADGVLFNKDRSRLIRCPPQKTGVYAIPDSVETLGDCAFAGCRKLERIDVPHRFQLTDETVFQNCEEKVRVRHDWPVSGSDAAGGEWQGHVEAVEGPFYFRAGERPGEVMLAGVDDSASGVVAVPEILGGRRVVRIMKHAFGFVPDLISVVIPGSVTLVDEYAFYACGKLSTIEVDPRNPALSSFDGCLYDKGLKRLIRCPCGKEGVLRIPASCGSIQEGAYSCCEKLSAFDVDPGNPVFSSQDGVLYDRSLKILVCCPPAKNGTVSIPDSVEHVSDDAFAGCEQVTNVLAPTRAIKDSLKICCSYLMLERQREARRQKTKQSP